ncbi:hypothetical protein Tco_0562267 [Tanacetum coccineum]
MLDTFDRDDLLNLHRLVMERFPNDDPVGYDLLLWGDLKILVDPKEDDDIWKNQHEWKMISWKLYKTYGVHTLMIVMVNVIPPNDDVPAIPEPALVDEDEEPGEEEEFKEKEPQEEEDIEVCIKKDENEPELTFPYEEMDPLNPPPPASDFESENVDVVETEDMAESKDAIVPASVYEKGESSIVSFLQNDGDSLLPCFMRRDIDSLFGRVASLSKRLCIHDTAHALVEKKSKAKDKHYARLILDLGDEVRCVDKVEERMTALEDRVEDFASTEERAECKKLKRDLEEERLSNTLLRLQNERVERDIYCARV